METTVTVETPTPPSGTPPAAETVPAPVAAAMSETARAAGEATAAATAATIDVTVLQSENQQLRDRVAALEALAVTQAAATASLADDLAATPIIETEPPVVEEVDVPAAPAPPTARPDEERGFWKTLLLGPHKPKDRAA